MLIKWVVESRMYLKSLIVQGARLHCSNLQGSPTRIWCTCIAFMEIHLEMARTILVYLMHMCVEKFLRSTRRRQGQSGFDCVDVVVLVFGFWCLLFGFLHLVFGLCFLVFGCLCLVFGVWCDQRWSAFQGAPLSFGRSHLTPLERYGAPSAGTTRLVHTWYGMVGLVYNCVIWWCTLGYGSEYGVIWV